MTKDYRASHIGEEKAKSYNIQFSKNPYRAMMWDLEREILDNIIDKYSGGKVGEYLDFACGSGRILNHLAPKASKSVGVDVSEDMLNIARQTCAGSELMNLDLTRESHLDNRSFDLITAFRFFPNAQPELRLEAMSSLVNKLATNGYLIFNNHKNSTSLIYQISKLPWLAKRTSMTETEVKYLLNYVGLKIVFSYHIGIIPSTDKYRLLPRKLLIRGERLLSKIPFFYKLSSNVIYVCSHK